MDWQTLFNVAVSTAGFALGWILNVVWSAVKDLQDDDTKLADKINSIEVIVVGQYVKRDEFDRKMDALFSKLDRIENKIDSKADK